MQNILDVEKIEKYYGNKGNITKAIDNISFNVDKAEFLGMMGPSGSSKTTLLNCISTIDTVTTGHIIINKKDITTLKSKALEEFRRDAAIKEVSEKLEITDVLDKFPFQMSGGQKQRVASSRVL